MAIPIRSPKEIEGLKAANKIVAETLDLIEPMAKPGVTLLELDKTVDDYIVSQGGRPAFKGLYGFPNAACISLNEVIIHGIPDNRVLKDGDIVGVDIGVELDGWYGDAARTFKVGNVSDIDEKIVDASKEVLLTAISKIVVGMRFKELSQILEDEIKARGFVPLRNYCGHGIGRKPHEEPSILNYVEGKPNQGPKIKDGMVFCIEPMLCQKEGNSLVLEDKWAVVSTDGLNGSHYEHTVAIIDGKAEILTETKKG